ncbi:MAG: peptide chain release factor-like protein [Elusimicrobiota bacterium]
MVKLKQSDIIEKFIRSGGKGGQNINKTSTCVYLKHIPTGLEVKCGSTRSQENNRILAYALLLKKVLDKENKINFEKKMRLEKLRRQTRKKPKKLKEKILRDKKITSKKKKLRKIRKDDIY